MFCCFVQVRFCLMSSCLGVLILFVVSLLFSRYVELCVNC
jgi:hypothetical protein